MQGALLVICCLISFAWSIVGVAHAYFSDVYWLALLFESFEVVRNLVWTLFLSSLFQKAEIPSLNQFVKIFKIFIVSLTVFGGLIILYKINIFSSDSIELRNLATFSYTEKVLFAILGLVLVEQFFRTIREERKWAFKFLIFGLGGMFAYDLFLYSDALLISKINLGLWEGRGIANAMIVPLIAVSAARNPDWSLDLFVSRKFVFQSAAILGISLYLLAMAAGGYYIRIQGGDWGSAIQGIFFLAALVLLLSLSFSGQVRAKVRVFVSKNFYNYKYDYRDEWRRFIDTLSLNDQPNILRGHAIQAMSQLVSSNGGVYWWRDGSKFVLREFLNIADKQIHHFSVSEELVAFLQRTQWIIDIKELHESPKLYDYLKLPACLVHYDWLRFVLPLFERDKLVGIMGISQPQVELSLNWEDRDLLKTAAYQATNYLALLEANQALIQAKQFEGFNQLSAFVVHDLKNLIAQLSLVVDNASKHKDNPVFLEDAVSTVRNSVDRMKRLMRQLKEGPENENIGTINLDKMIEEIIKEKSYSNPVPILQVQDSVQVRGDSEKLSNAVGHIVQNAKDAAAPSGEVNIKLYKDQNWAMIDIRDNGQGMDDEFIRTKLFRPFESTKGLTGMGIGAYESKLVIERLGGELSVESEIKAGTRFLIKLPLSSGE